MKKWPWIVALLYVWVLITILAPLIFIAFLPQTLNTHQSDFVEVVQKAFTAAWFWIALGIMGISQFALLSIPVCLANRRPVSRRPILTTVIAAAFMMGLLVFGAAVSITEIVTRGGGDSLPLCLAASLGFVSWACWAVYFYRSTRTTTPNDILSQFKPYFWTGSILELLVAIPTHIVARSRNYCCAGFMTFIGLVCGISVMLFAYGPGVYLLFVERWKRLHPDQPPSGVGGVTNPERMFPME